MGGKPGTNLHILHSARDELLPIESVALDGGGLPGRLREAVLLHGKIGDRSSGGPGRDCAYDLLVVQ